MKFLELLWALLCSQVCPLRCALRCNIQMAFAGAETSDNMLCNNISRTCMKDLNFGHCRRVEHRVHLGAELSVSRHNTTASVKHQVGAVECATRIRITTGTLDNIYQHVNLISSWIKRYFWKNLQKDFDYDNSMSRTSSHRWFSRIIADVVERSAIVNVRVAQFDGIFRELVACRNSVVIKGSFW